MEVHRIELVTQLLRAVHRGEVAARDELWMVVYQELHQLAEAQMAHEAPGRTLQPTALVNEAYLRLMIGDGGFENRRHFYAAAAKAMRRILIDDARRRNRAKRGGPSSNAQSEERPAGATSMRHRRVSLDERTLATEKGSDETDLLALDEALSQLDQEYPNLARVVELRYFAGFGVEQTGEVMGIAPRTVEKYWRMARAFLHEAMSDS